MPFWASQWKKKLLGILFTSLRNIFFTAKGAKIFRKGRKQGRMSKQFVQFARGEKRGTFFLIKNLWGVAEKKKQSGVVPPNGGQPPIARALSCHLTLSALW
jgi:hypothetical protein